MCIYAYEDVFKADCNISTTFANDKKIDSLHYTAVFTVCIYILKRKYKYFFSKGVHIILYTFMLNKIFVFYFIRRLCNRNQNVMQKDDFGRKTDFNRIIL